MWQLCPPTPIWRKSLPTMVVVQTCRGFPSRRAVPTDFNGLNLPANVMEPRRTMTRIRNGSHLPSRPPWHYSAQEVGIMEDLYPDGFTARRQSDHPGRPAQADLPIHPPTQQRQFGGAQPYPAKRNNATRPPPARMHHGRIDTGTNLECQNNIYASRRLAYGIIGTESHVDNQMSIFKMKWPSGFLYLVSLKHGYVDFPPFPVSSFIVTSSTIFCSMFKASARR
jgi:hypothetical protein